MVTRTPKQPLRLAGFLLALTLIPAAANPAGQSDLRVGVAGHAFDHLGSIDRQAQTAVQCGATVAYCTGFGEVGYQGLPVEPKMDEIGNATAAYLKQARRSGLRLALGYLCATSIVSLERFDKSWTPQFRAQFSAAPANWLQQDRDGKPLASWYGGDYRPACMNHPDWRAYERYLVRRQIEAGHDGIFFDNPTVHSNGCYCRYCMAGFAQFPGKAAGSAGASKPTSIEEIRRIAVERPADFMRYRCTIAAGFLSEMRRYARTINPRALVTCNNSLNSPDVFFSQCRTYAYNIHELSRAEDLVVVEDMVSQPRVLANGDAVEYGPVYELLRAICRGKPIAAVTLAGADYHTPPNLMRLAMAEAAAHNASYLSWPTWPESNRANMIAAVRPQADLLRRNASLLNGTDAAPDAVLFMPFRRWTDTADCQPLKIARALSRANIAFEVVAEEEIARRLKSGHVPVLLAESLSILSTQEGALIADFQRRGGRVVWTDKPDWLSELHKWVQRPLVEVLGPGAIRAVMRAQRGRRIIHLLNMNVQRLSSFEDRVTPAAGIRLIVRVPFAVRSISALSADANGTQGPVAFKSMREGEDVRLELTVPHLAISTILVIE